MKSKKGRHPVLIYLFKWHDYMVNFEVLFVDQKGHFNLRFGLAYKDLHNIYYTQKKPSQIKPIDVLSTFSCACVSYLSLNVFEYISVGTCLFALTITKLNLHKSSSIRAFLNLSLIHDLCMSLILLNLKGQRNKNKSCFGLYKQQKLYG